MVKSLPAKQETQIWSLGWENPLEKELATHSCTLAWKISWTEEPGRLQSMGSQRVRHDWVILLSLPSAYQKMNGQRKINIMEYCLSILCNSLHLVAQMVKHLSTMRETRVQSLGWEDPLDKEMAIHSSTIAWKIPWTEEPGRLQSMRLQRVGHDEATS